MVPRRRRLTLGPPAVLVEDDLRRGLDAADRLGAPIGSPRRATSRSRANTSGSWAYGGHQPYSAPKRLVVSGSLIGRKTRWPGAARRPRGANARERPSARPDPVDRCLAGHTRDAAGPTIGTMPAAGSLRSDVPPTTSPWSRPRHGRAPTGRDTARPARRGSRSRSMIVRAPVVAGQRDLVPCTAARRSRKAHSGPAQTCGPRHRVEDSGGPSRRVHQLP